MDFILINEDEELKEFLTTNFYWFSGYLKDSYLIDKDGSMSLCSLLSEFSTYFKAEIENISDEQMKKLFDKLEESFSQKGSYNECICTCFLENVAGEWLTNILSKYLGEKSMNYYIQWDR